MTLQGSNIVDILWEHTSKIILKAYDKINKNN